MRPTKSRLLANVLRVVQTEVAAALREYVHATGATVTAVMSKRHRARRIAAMRNPLRSQSPRSPATVAPLDVVQSNFADASKLDLFVWLTAFQFKAGNNDARPTDPNQAPVKK